MVESSELVKYLTDYKAGLAAKEASQMTTMALQWGRVEQSCWGQINALTAEIKKRKEAGETVSLNKLYQLERYQAFLAQADRQLEKYIAFADETITKNRAVWMQDAVDAAHEATGLGIKEFGHVKANFKSMPTARVEQMIAQTTKDSPLGKLLADAKVASLEKATSHLIDATAFGWNPQKTARFMADGLGLTLQRSIVIARDQQLRACRYAQDKAYQSFGIVKAKKRLSAKDLHTCMGCLARDGEVLPITVPAYDHVCGRCVFVPWIQGLPEPKWLSAEEWFLTLDPSAQKKMMGEGSWELWKAGQFPFKALGYTKHHDVWGDSIAVPSLEELLHWKESHKVEIFSPPPSPGYHDVFIPDTDEFRSVLAAVKKYHPDWSEDDSIQVALSGYKALHPDLYDQFMANKGAFSVVSVQLGHGSDYATGLLAGRNDEYVRLLAQAEAKIFNQKVEHAYIFGPNGEKLGHYVGDETHVEFPADLKIAGATLTHNHPSSSVPLSMNDLRYGNLVKLAEIRAVNQKDGLIYYVRFNGYHMGPDEFKSAWDKILLQAYDDADHHKLDGKNRPWPGFDDTLPSHIQQLAIQRMAEKYGWSFGKVPIQSSTEIERAISFRSGKSSLADLDRLLAGTTSDAEKWVVKQMLSQNSVAQGLMTPITVPDNNDWESQLYKYADKWGMTAAEAAPFVLENYKKNYPDVWAEDQKMGWTKTVWVDADQLALATGQPLAPKVSPVKKDAVSAPYTPEFNEILDMIKKKMSYADVPTQVKAAINEFKMTQPDDYKVWKAGKLATQNIWYDVVAPAPKQTPVAISAPTSGTNLKGHYDFPDTGNFVKMLKETAATHPEYSGQQKYSYALDIYSSKYKSEYQSWLDGSVKTKVLTAKKGETVYPTVASKTPTAAPVTPALPSSVDYPDHGSFVKSLKHIATTQPDLSGVAKYQAALNHYQKNDPFNYAAWKSGIFQTKVIKAKASELLPTTAVSPVTAAATKATGMKVAVKAAAATPPVVPPPPLKIEHKASMTAQEASEWAKDSFLQGSYYYSYENKKAATKNIIENHAISAFGLTTLHGKTPYGYTKASVVVEYKINVKNPLVFNGWSDYSAWTKLNNIPFGTEGNKIIAASGYDAVVFMMPSGKVDEVVVFDQKSLTQVVDKNPKGKVTVKPVAYSPTTLDAVSLTKPMQTIHEDQYVQAYLATSPSAVKATTVFKPTATAYTPPIPVTQTPVILPTAPVAATVATTTPKPADPAQLAATNAKILGWTKPPFDVSTFKDTGEGGSIGGMHAKSVLQDTNGDKWLFKPGSPIHGHIDCATAELMKMAGLEAPEFYQVTYNGQSGSIQKMYANPKPVFNKGYFDATQLAESQTFELQKQAVFDWLIGNHDSHAAQFLGITKGGEQIVVGIDKGQAFKFYGQDKLNYSYNPNPSQPVYHDVHQKYAQGQTVPGFVSLYVKSGEAPTPKQEELLAYINKLSNISDEEVKALIRPYAEAAAAKGYLAKGAGPGITNNVEGFLDAVVSRKNNLLKDWTKFHTELEAEKFQLAASKVFATSGGPPPAHLGLSSSATQIVDFKSDSQAMSWAKSKYPPPSQVGISSTSSDAWRYYTTTDGCERVNNALRGIHTTAPSIQSRINSIDESLTARPPTEYYVTNRGCSQRSLGLPSGADMRQFVGTIVSDPAYLSTSIGTSAAFSSKSVQLKIIVPPGTPSYLITYNSAYGEGEREILLGRGLQLYIHSAKKVGSQYIVEAEVVPDSGPIPWKKP